MALYFMKPTLLFVEGDRVDVIPFLSRLALLGAPAFPFVMQNFGNKGGGSDPNRADIS